VFSEQYAGFEWFGWMHLLALLDLIVLISLVIIFRKKINPTWDLWIRRSIAVLMIIMEWTFYIWAISRGGFQASLLPMGVCAIAMYVTAYTLWTKNEKTFQVIFPWAIVGALLSLLIADLDYTFPHFRFIHYFGNHGLFLLGNIYLLVISRFSFQYKHLLRSSLILFLYSIVVYPINFFLNTNHLFLRELPSEVHFLFSFLGDFWVIGFMIGIFILFHLVYLVLRLFQTKSSETTSKKESISG